ncbi:hypothetical protein M3D15_01040 [Pseudoclavibacter alba]|uniref:Uncharacterized protein n=1 Tax=Pseudoclavibacter albus TaxID=272241 RepID=A0ABT2HUF6_9MICO|nr:hypothetical protein [Pseudoclavibacter alba]MCT2041932.1 hypothetical protein [Pseudoclavibacter alba]
MNIRRILTKANPAVRSARVGNDGLTDAERSERANRYLNTAGSKTITPAERATLQAWRAKRAHA